MAKNRKLIFYLLVVLVFGVLIYWITERGSLLEGGQVDSSAAATGASNSAFAVFLDALEKNLFHPLAILILQIIAIILVSRVLGALFHRISQPTVIGEIIAGIILGPSLLGLFFPGFSAFLFPPESLDNLQFLSQVGLILFMFVIGLELDWKVVKDQAHDAVVVSHASIVIPYFLGMGLAYFLYEAFAPENISFLSFALFMGIAMSITAFPVLARVIQERNLTKTNLGTMAITCAAADDITAWCLLAVVIAIVKAGSFISALFSIGLAIAFVMIMMMVVQPFLNRLGKVYSARETINKTIVAVSFLILLASAYIAEIIGIHALFGAFLAGVIMPASFNFRRILMEKMEDVSVVLLLPLFFVFTGLRTEIGLLNDSTHWLVCALIVLTAVVGKFGGTAVASRIVGQSWKESLSLGALMNTRGLMELIVLNIGYDLGVLTAEVFAMLVLMALVTTFMTGPALDLINHLFREQRLSPATKGQYKILLAFGPAEKGKKLLRLADQLSGSGRSKASISALHLTPSSDINPKEARAYEEESFRLVRAEAEARQLKINTLYNATNDINREIAREANDGHYDLLLVGGSHSLFTDDVVGGKVKTLMGDTRCHVGVLVEKHFEKAERILVMLNDHHDLFLLAFAERLLQSPAVRIIVQDQQWLIASNAAFSQAYEKMRTENIGRVDVSENDSLKEEFLRSFDIVLISTSGWREFKRTKNSIRLDDPPLLIFKPVVTGTAKPEGKPL